MSSDKHFLLILTFFSPLFLLPYFVFCLCYCFIVGFRAQLSEMDLSQFSVKLPTFFLLFARPLLTSVPFLRLTLTHSSLLNSGFVIFRKPSKPVKIAHVLTHIPKLNFSIVIITINGLFYL